jgi:hypothetical protein
MSRGVKWAVGPALICVYIAHYMDRQTDPRLPNVGADGKSMGVRLLYSVLFSLFVLAVLPPPTAAITASPSSSWSMAKLQVVAMGTIFLMTLTLALVAQFGLRKPQAELLGTERSPAKLIA